MADNLRKASKALCVAAAVIVLLTLIFVCIQQEAYANPVQVHKKDTHTVIVGDSRVVGLWNSKYRTYSLIGRSGGRYSTNDNFTIQSKRYGKEAEEETTLKKSRYTTIMNSIKAGLKKKHKCRVAVFATINECRKDRVDEIEDGDPDAILDNAALKLVKFAKKCRIKQKIRTTKKERAQQKKLGKKVTKFKYVRSKVYVMQCVRASDFEWGPNYPVKNVKKYNKYIKKYCKEYGLKYVTFDREPKDSEYSEVDGLHFIRAKKGYNKLMWEKVKTLKFE